jgi:cytochrome oxidase Cu insertion factor (SCO1/SenC/PrrC family)
MKRLPLIVLPILALLVFLAAAAVWRQANSRSQSEAVASPASEEGGGSTADEFGGPFSLTDQNGKRRTDMDFRGKYMLVFFGYTYCPDVCPTALAVEAQALDMLGPSASRIVPIFITVDPKRDTPGKLKSYLTAFEASPPSPRPNFVGLTGTDEDIAAVARAYRVYYQAHIDGFRTDADYSVDHTSDTYLMSPEGKFVAYYSLGISPDEMAADLTRKIVPPG